MPNLLESQGVIVLSFVGICDCSRCHIFSVNDDLMSSLLSIFYCQEWFCS
jgi:hypothetical protein